MVHNVGSYLKSNTSENSVLYFMHWNNFHHWFTLCSVRFLSEESTKVFKIWSTTLILTSISYWYILSLYVVHLKDHPLPIAFQCHLCCKSGDYIYVNLFLDSVLFHQSISLSLCQHYTSTCIIGIVIWWCKLSSFVLLQSRMDSLSLCVST